MSLIPPKSKKRTIIHVMFSQFADLQISPLKMHRKMQDSRQPWDISRVTSGLNPCRWLRIIEEPICSLFPARQMPSATVTITKVTLEKRQCLHLTRVGKKYRGNSNKGEWSHCAKHCEDFEHITVPMAVSSTCVVFLQRIMAETRNIFGCHN